MKIRMDTQPYRISSTLSGFYKIGFPAIWIIFFGIGTLLSNGKTLVAWVFGSAFLLWTTRGLKRVRLDDKCLYVSDFLEGDEIAIPLDAITDITENSFLNIHPVTVHLRNETEFGNKTIRFMPKTSLLHFPFGSHPIVAELRLAAGLRQL